MTTEGFKPPTFRTGIWHSIQLNYVAYILKYKTKLKFKIIVISFQRLSADGKIVIYAIAVIVFVSGFKQIV